MTLRAALRSTLSDRRVSLYAVARERQWPRSAEVQVSRWLRRAVDPRTGRRYSLPLWLRLEVAALTGYAGQITTQAEAKRFARLAEGGS